MVSGTNSEIDDEIEQAMMEDASPSTTKTAKKYPRKPPGVSKPRSKGPARYLLFLNGLFFK